MIVEINSMDNGSGMNTMLRVFTGYNRRNQIFTDLLCDIETDDFIGCFDEEKQDEISDKIESGKTVFHVCKETLLLKCKTIHRSC